MTQLVLVALKLRCRFVSLRRDLCYTDYDVLIAKFICLQMLDQVNGQTATSGCSYPLRLCLHPLEFADRWSEVSAAKTISRSRTVIKKKHRFEWLKERAANDRYGGNNVHGSWPAVLMSKQTILLYIFFWVFPWRQFEVCRRFGTLCRFHLQRLDVEYGVWIVSGS